MTSAGGFGPTDVFWRKRSDNVAAATCFCLCESEATATQHDVGHSVVATGRGVLRLSSSISVGVWNPEKGTISEFISPPSEEGVFCTCRFAFGTREICLMKINLNYCSVIEGD
ncbi:hypothetical protein [Lysinibacillus xylanilyticus]|uniref:hypothetical protein n=1 Tax=Lysinibacillus xylanilyticus TaxID=582475 RepID=UPI003D058A12